MGRWRPVAKPKLREIGSTDPPSRPTHAPTILQFRKLRRGAARSCSNAQPTPSRLRHGLVAKSSRARRAPSSLRYMGACGAKLQPGGDNPAPPPSATRRGGRQPRKPGSLARSRGRGRSRFSTTDGGAYPETTLPIRTSPRASALSLWPPSAGMHRSPSADSAPRPLHFHARAHAAPRARTRSPRAWAHHTSGRP